VRRLTDEQRALLAAAAPEDRDLMLREVRLEHVTRSLVDAVAEGRLSRADADSVLERLGHGEDVHQMRDELRRLGVLPGAGRPSRPGSDDFPLPTTEDGWARP
jgi:hypothetical protein